MRVYNGTMPRQGSVAIVRSSDTYEGKQGLSYAAGVSAETTGSTGLCLHRLVVPPGGRAKAHLHAHHESAIYVLSGEVAMYWGAELEQSQVVRAGDFVYIPPGVPHLPVNLSDSEEATALVARTDPNEQESVEVLPHLDALPHLHPGPGARS
jgi:uncharacterized RmlC-like cupin family protein